MHAVTFITMPRQFDAEKPMNILLLDLGQSAYQVTAVSFVTGSSLPPPSSSLAAPGPTLSTLRATCWSPHTTSASRPPPGKLTVRAATYDRNLGGRDFDAVIARHIAGAFKAKYGDDPWENPKARMKLFVSAEKAKKTLSPVG